MKLLATVLISASLALAGNAIAQDKKGAMAKPMTMTTKECQDHMAMKMDGMKKDDATMKKDAMCADMLKKDSAMKKDSTMKKDGMMKMDAMPKK